MQQISVGDGFRFGCGFMLAASIAWLAMMIIGGILTALFGAAFGSLFERIRDLGQFIPMLGLI